MFDTDHIAAVWNDSGIKTNYTVSGILFIVDKYYYVIFAGNIFMHGCDLMGR